MPEIAGRFLVSGSAIGRAICLDEALSFWGGFDPATGRIIGRYKRAGQLVAGRVLVMPSGRGSSSSSSVLAEAISRSTAPIAIVLSQTDEIVALGSLIAAELYGFVCPVVVVTAEERSKIKEGTAVRIAEDATVKY